MSETKTYHAFEQRYPFQTEYLISEVEVYADPVDNPDNSAIVRAKWDTGANHTVISVDLMQRLQLIPIDSEVISGVGGSQVIDVVRLAVKLPNDLFISSKHIGVCRINSAQKTDILIGMDIIHHGDLYISNTGGKTRFSFVIPSLPSSFSLAEEADKLNEHTNRNQ